MDMAPIIARVKDQVPAFKIVGGAAGIAAAAKALAAAPAAFVVEETDSAGDNNIANDVHQRVTVNLGVFLAVPNAQDSSGEAGGGALEILRLALRAALLGWSPAAGIDPITYVSGVLFRFEPGLLWWRENWRTAHYIRSAA